MNTSYQVIERHNDIGLMIQGLHNEAELSVGIMDTSSPDDLIQSITWMRENFNHNIHVITQISRLDSTFIQSMSDVTFILFATSPSTGEMVNAMADSCHSTFFLMLRSDTDIVDFNWNEIKSLMTAVNPPVVLTPILFNKDKELLPTVRGPRLEGSQITVESCMPSTGNDMNLYPFYGLGLYNRAIFQRLRSYDTQIEGTYFQTLDFGTKSWLYGYPIYSVNSIAMIFISRQFLMEDRSEKEGCQRFYARALGLRMVNGRPKTVKVRNADRTVLATEVKEKAGLYRTDFETLCSQWEYKD